MVQALVRELELRKDYLRGQPIQTIYFGGGTPSLLSEKELYQILQAVRKHYTVSSSVEQTIECNPEDLTEETLYTLFQLGFHRLSIGIQTFDDAILRFMNRNHTAAEAQQAVRKAKEHGFENLTIDLMYALPNAASSILEQDLEKALELDIPHISAYCFTLEEKTVFGKWAAQKKISPQEEDFERAQYTMLTDALSDAGFEQYEISNFARHGQYSKHNTAYWFGTHYLGIGPGAHSFNGTQRHWNISNNPRYIAHLQQEILPLEQENLTKRDHINERLLTRLRTKWGINTRELQDAFDFDLLKERSSEIQRFISQGGIRKESTTLFLTENGKLIADRIIADLML